jgi:hypothetical protein
VSLIRRRRFYMSVVRKWPVASRGICRSGVARLRSESNPLLQRDVEGVGVGEGGVGPDDRVDLVGRRVGLDVRNGQVNHLGPKTHDVSDRLRRKDDCLAVTMTVLLAEGEATTQNDYAAVRMSVLACCGGVVAFVPLAWTSGEWVSPQVRRPCTCYVCVHVYVCMYALMYVCCFRCKAVARIPGWRWA